MAPPPSSLAPAIHPVIREVTEDTPPDLLEGTMDLLVLLPTKKTLRMTVNRRTPMMDLLIQVTTANKINPGGHIVQVRNERGTELQYKPSTPIGALDTTTIEIVPRNQVNEYIIVKKQSAKINTHPFEHTFRLQVHLPRNQLYVMRVGPKTLLQDILEEVCQEKNLDIAKYEIRHPVNLDEKLALTSRLGDFGLQQLTVVSRNSRINSSVSTADIMALQQSEDGRNKGCLDSAFKYSRSSVGDSSVSSESAASARGTSPSRSDDDSRSISPLPPIAQPKLNLKPTVSNASSSTLLKSSMSNLSKAPSTSNMDLSKPKKRAAPPPPQSPASEEAQPPISQAIHKPLSQSLSQPPLGLRPVPRKKDPPKEPPVKATDTNHSRHSSDSSGYHEASILSDNQQEISRSDRPMSSSKRIGSLNSLSNQGMMGSSTTNLTSVSSLSSTSLASSNGGSRNKRKAPKPPVLSLQAQNELDEETGAGIEPETPTSPSTPPARTGLEVDVQVEVHTRREAEDENEGTLKPGTVSPSSRTSSTFSSPTLTKSGTSSSSSSHSSSSSSSSPSNSKASMTPLSSKLLSNNPSSSPVAVVPRQSPSSTTLDASSSSPQPPRPAPSPLTQANPSSSAPLPQPRTKPRDTPANPQPNTLAIPQPRAKPRPDRKTVTEPPPAMTQAAAPVPLRNPMSRIGVKVFPDNALEDRTTARLSASHLREHRSSSSPPVHDNSKVKGFPENSARSSATQLRDTRSSSSPPVHDNSKVKGFPENSARSSATQLRDTRSSTPPLHANNAKPLPSKPQPPAPLFPSTTGSLRSLQGTKNSSSSVQNTSRPGHDSATDSDSDHLDEHLELFEARKRRSHKARAPIPASYKPIPTATATTPKPLPRAASDSNILNELSGEDEADVVSAIVSLQEPKQRTSSYPTSKQVHKARPDMSNLPLNRWGNRESLQEADERPERQAVSMRLSTTSPSVPKPKLTTSTATKSTEITTEPKPLISKTLAPATKTDPILTTAETSDDDGSGHTTTSHEDSSESEASNADSGLPATATVTPSPISLDHEDMHGSEHSSVKSVHSSSRRSSLQSDQSESWRELLQSKVDGQQNTEIGLETVVPKYNKASPSPDASPETKIKVNPSSNFQTSPSADLTKLNNAPSEPEQLDSLSSASDEERKQKLKTSKDVKDNGSISVPRKLPKAESFSHHSEFDVVKMKRKTFAGSVTTRQQTKTLGSTSSSDEDEQRFTSMQNLSKARAETTGSLQRPGKDERPVRKATSVLGIQELGPDIRDNPQLMQTFQVELETQFEQWKEEFIQRHLGNSSKSGSMDSGSAQDELQHQTKSPTPAPVEPKASNLSSHSSSSISLKVSDDEVEDFDPAQPQIVHSVGTRPTVTEFRRQSSEESEIKSKSITPDKNNGSSTGKASGDSGKPTSSGTESEDTVNEDETDMNDVQIMPQRRVKPNNVDTPVYRYSGPPSIQMGTWGERPHRTISVKKDKDYIMGMGQQDGKVELKTSNSNTLGNRVHSFHGGSPSPTPTPGSTRTLPSSRWSNVNVSTNVAPEPNHGTLPNVVSSWKLRLEESEKARKNPELVPQARAQSSEPEQKVEIEIKSMSATSTLERPRISKPSFSISSASSTLERPVRRSPSPAMFSISPAASNPIQLRPSEPRKFQSPEPKPVTIDTVDSPKPVTVNQPKPDPITVSHTKIQSTQSFSTPSSNNGSMEDKKRFFQGVKPVESPTKEVPLPAVNLKNNIATIQKVFEQRQLQKSSSSASMSGSERSFPSRESSASPALSNSSYSSSGSASKKPTEFIGAQSSSNIMVQKLIGKGTGFNLDALRRTPSPLVGSYNDSERSTPSPTVAESQGHGPVRISTTGHNIKNVGNKAIITVGGDAANNNQFKQQLRVNGETYHQPVKVNVNGKTNDSMIIVNSSSSNNSAPSNYASIKETFSKNKPIIVQETVKEPLAKRGSTGVAVIVQETVKDPIAKRNSVSIPPPPPPMQQHEVQRPTSLGKFSRSSTGSSQNSNSTATPTSPMTPSEGDPRAGILTAIKNANGNFGLKKTNSTMLLR